MTNDVFTTVADANDNVVIVNNERILFVRQLNEQEWLVFFDNGHEWKIDDVLAGTLLRQLRFVARPQPSMPVIGNYPYISLMR
jgi:hypothetical protein